MHRIDGPGATPGDLFTEGDPVGGVEATTVTADWLNDVQENLMKVLEQAGIAPTKGRAADLYDAIKALITGSPSDQVLAANGRKRFPGGFLVQWGSSLVPASTTQTLTFPLAYDEVYQIVSSFGVPALGSANSDIISVTQYRLQNTHTVAQTMRWWSVGKKGV